MINNEVYYYDVGYLKQVKKFRVVCDRFIRSINKYPDSFSILRGYLGDEILNQTSEVELKGIFKSYFLSIPINKCEFMGMKILDNSVSLYFNVYYNNDRAQTYAFSFYLNQDDKIDGINIPQ